MLKPKQSFQDLILKLQHYWSDYGCNIVQPHDMEMGAGTFAPATFLRAIGSEPWQAAFVQASRRPTDSRYGQNPNRMQHYYQFQVILKPSPDNIQDLYLQSLAETDIDLKAHDIRFVEDNWESPTLGAWGLGWEVWIDGMEVSQFTYFQQVGGLSCQPISGEITYGLERLAMYLQNIDNVFELCWQGGTTYGDVFLQNEIEQSHYNFKYANIDNLFMAFDQCELSNQQLLKEALVHPAYEQVLKASHLFNLLDARKAISTTDRANFILRVRTMSHEVAKCYYDSRQKLNFPMNQ